MSKSIGSHKKLNSLRDIPQAKCNGYYWLSDSIKPRVISDNVSTLFEYEKENAPSNPFIVEAALYYPEADTTVMIRHGENGYLMDMIQWQLGEEGEVTERSFLANQRFSNVQYLRIRTAWINVPDSLCQNINVLEPGWSGFVGFRSTKNSEVK